jgi:hypothetical protein
MKAKNTRDLVQRKFSPKSCADGARAKRLRGRTVPTGPALADRRNGLVSQT